MSSNPAMSSIQLNLNLQKSVLSDVLEPLTSVANESTGLAGRTRHRQGSGENPRRTILLIGSARSGTSWSLSILNSHPKVLGCHEPFKYMGEDRTMARCMERLKKGCHTAVDKGRLLEWIKVAYPETHKPPFAQKSFYRYSKWTRWLVWMTAKLVPFTEDIYRTVSAPKLHEDDFLVIKNSTFPKMDVMLSGIVSDIVVLLRHPCAVVRSLKRGIDLGLMSVPNANAVWNGYSDSLTQLGFTQDQVETSTVAELLALRWLCETLLSEKLAKQFRTKTLVYEHMLESPIVQWKETFDWLGIPFEPSVADYISKTSKPNWNVRQLLGKRVEYYSISGPRRRGEASAAEIALDEQESQQVLGIVCPHFDLSKHWSPASRSCY